jgi:hypothetical protein
MSTTQSEVFDAFRSIGVDKEKALKAAAALNGRDREFTAALSERDRDIAIMKTDIVLLKWMTGFTLAMVTAVFLKLFIH